jgi:hypothetical protein
MRLSITLVLFLVLTSLPVLPAAAQIYKYTDERGQSHYVDGVQNVPERYRSRATPIGLSNTPGSAPAAASGPPAATGGPAGRPPGPAAGGGVSGKGSVTIEFDPNKPILVEGLVNGSGSVKLILDTGADRTMISPRALIAAGVSLTEGAQRSQVRGVAGQADTQSVPISSLSVGGASVGRLMVLAHDMENPDVDGLLGRDFLNQFTVQIDPAKGVVTISPKQ